MWSAPTCILLTSVTLSTLLVAPPAALAWEPTKPIEFIVPAGTGGGADQMARLIYGIAEKHRLSPRPIIVVNKSGGAGAEGFLHVKGKKGDAHTIIITLSNLFTTPLHTGVPFNWRDLTPVARLALDQFILWVNAETPYKTAKDYLAAVKANQCKDREKGVCSMGGTGSAQEDQIITILLEQSQGVKFTYVPFKGGGEVCVNLVGKHVDSTVNNPIECVSHWKANRVRPLAVFDTERISVGDWKNIPTVKEALGADLNYLMLRGIFGAPDMPKDAVDWYVGFLKKVTDTPEWKKYMEDGALKPAFVSGSEYVKWVEQNEALHKELMTKGGLLKK
jgi:putative tricarboxylic transport membrane protein